MTKTAKALQRFYPVKIANSAWQVMDRQSDTTAFDSKFIFWRLNHARSACAKLNAGQTVQIAQMIVTP